MENEVQAIKHVCGVCKDEWLTEAEYLAHTCLKTGLAVTDPQHLVNSTTPDFEAVSQAAVERGAATQVQDALPQQAPAENQPEASTISLN